MSTPRTARHVRLQPDSVLARRRGLGAPPPSRRRSAIVAAAIGQSERIRMPVVDPANRVCGPGSRSPGIVPLGTPQSARSVTWSSGISCLFQTLGTWMPFAYAARDARCSSSQRSLIHPRFPACTTGTLNRERIAAVVSPTKTPMMNHICSLAGTNPASLIRDDVSGTDGRWRNRPASPRDAGLV
jgi:hypothetical protein